MESLKDFLTPTTFSFYGYIVAIVCLIGGTIFSTSIGILRASERRNFHCNIGSKSPFDKNFLRASCFDQYDQQYNLPLPLYGFVLLSFFILTLISIVYSWCCVKSRVEEVEQACKIDAENPRPRQTITTRRVFNCYLAQLLGRLSLGIVFTVLQNFVLYPSGFPTIFVCEMKLEKSKVPVTNMTFTNSSFIDCRNSMGSDKDVWAMLVWIVNMILACLVAGEIIYVIRKACWNKTFLNDSEFCQRHLFNRRKTPSIIDQYRMIQQTRTIKDTQVLEPLIPPSPGENEVCKNLDEMYVNLIIHTGRSRPDLDMERIYKHRILEEYVKSPDDSIIINKLEELLLPNKDSSDPRKILIVGCPGIGKTLLCKKLLRELSKGEMLQEEARTFLHLFLFHFRNFNSEEMKSMSLETLLSRGKYSEGKLDQEVFQFILEHPDKILLVFDGLDEFKDHGECMEEEEKHDGNGVADIMLFGALYVKLVKGKILNGATVLTTTRPYAIDSVEGLPFDRTVEILGFSTEKVKEYCGNFFHDDRNAMERIWQHVESNLNLLYLCYIPVNCFIVCSLLEKIIELKKSSLEGVALPTRLTEIYEGALRLFIFKHHPEYQTKTLKRSDLTSNGTFSSSVEETLLKLEALAMKGIDERRLVFELEEVKGMENCGLLNRMPDVENAPFTYKPQYCFIHLTIQEFVAARGIAKMDHQELQNFISSKKEDEGEDEDEDEGEDGKWHLVIQFVAGLLKSKEAVVNNIFVENLQDALLSNSHDSKSMALLMMKCLYEANDISSVKRAAAELKSNSKFTSHIELSYLSLTPVDCTAIVYFLKHIHNLEYLNVSGNPLGDGGCSELSKLINTGGPQKLNLNNCGISDQGFITILEAMKTAETCNLSQLNLSLNNDITDKGYSYLCDALMDEKCKLTGLVIDDMLVDEHISLKLSNALKHENCNLNKLHFGLGKDLGKERGYLNLCSALVDKNCKLRELMLLVTISHACMSVLKNENCKLSKLTFLRNGVTGEELLCVCEALKHVNCKFTELHLTPLDVSHVFELSDTPQNTNAIFIRDFLTLSKFSITDLGISYLCDALKHKDCKLTRLSLVGASPETVTKKGIEDLQNAITHDNCKLEELTLDINEQGDLWSDKESRTLECTCILNNNGHKVLATKGKSGQYEEIALSSMVFDGKHYIIKIER